MTATFRLRVTGRVQGVGFREALRAEALHLGVTGWVRNRRDGSVEAILQGGNEALQALIAWARRGPPAALVTSLQAEPAVGDLDRAYHGFERLPSA